MPTTEYKVSHLCTSSDIKLLDAINNIYSDFLYYGYRRIIKQLQLDETIQAKLVQKAMKYMDIEALYPKPKTIAASKV